MIDIPRLHIGCNWGMYVGGVDAYGGCTLVELTLTYQRRGRRILIDIPRLHIGCNRGMYVGGVDAYLVFSGHGAFLDNSTFDYAGYEPLVADKIYTILNIINNYQQLQVCTFEQASLKTYFLYHGEIVGNSVFLDAMQLAFLHQYGFSLERILQLI